jgi:hypothetical protein
MITICSDCGGRDIHQQGSVMVPINKPNSEEKADKILANLWMDDYYWCMDCEMECTIEEVEDKEIFRG